MTEWLFHIGEILWHTVIDTAKLVPFLFLSYLLMELLEHRSSDAAESWLRRSGRIGPLIGGAFGVVPQCGFSAAASGMYAGRIITSGTLIAVYLSTSDEMLPILISRGAPISLVLKILGTKLMVGIVTGFAVDAVAGMRCRKGQGEQTPRIEELCEREHCRCEDHFLLSAIKHTLHITLFILLFTFFLNLIIHGVGEERLAALLTGLGVGGNLLAAVVGLIPNCASSIVITELYLSGMLSVGAMFSGLLVNAGIGSALLLRNNRPFTDSIRIIVILLCIGATFGILVDLTPLASLFS